MHNICITIVSTRSNLQKETEISSLGARIEESALLCRCSFSHFTDVEAIYAPCAPTIKCSSSNKIRANEELHCRCLSYITIIRPASSVQVYIQLPVENSGQTHLKPSAAPMYMHILEYRRIFICISYVHTYPGMGCNNACWYSDARIHCAIWHHSNLKWHQIDKSQLHIEWWLTEFESFAAGVQRRFNIYFPCEPAPVWIRWKWEAAVYSDTMGTYQLLMSFVSAICMR